MIRQFLLILFSLLSIFFVKAQDVPNTFLIQGSCLADSKKALNNGNDEFALANRILIKNADLALGRGPYSVTFKKTTPSGGSVHDYFSYATYWWPDPAKKSGLPFIQKDGKVNPIRDSIDDRIMLINLGSDVKLLGLAYYFTGEEKYALKVRELSRMFFLNPKTKMNPNFEYSQFIMGKPHSGGATVSGTPLISVIDGIQLVKESKSWKSNDYKEIQSWYRVFLDWMLNSKKGKQQALSQNNVGTYYSLQTIAYALFIDDLSLAKTIFSKRVYGMIDVQIDKNGVMRKEMNRATPWNYVKFNLTALYQLSLMGQKMGIDLWTYISPNGGNINNAFEWLKPYAQGKVKWNYKNDQVSRSQILAFLNRYKSIKSEIATKKSPKISNLRQAISLLVNTPEIE